MKLTRVTQVISGFSQRTIQLVCILQDWGSTWGSAGYTTPLPFSQLTTYTSGASEPSYRQHRLRRTTGALRAPLLPVWCPRGHMHLPLAWFMVSALSSMHSFFPDFLLSFRLLTREGLLGWKHHAWVKGEQWALVCWGSPECGGCIVVPELPPSKIWSYITPSRADGDIYHFLPQQKVLIKETFFLRAQLAPVLTRARALGLWLFSCPFRMGLYPYTYKPQPLPVHTQVLSCVLHWASLTSIAYCWLISLDWKAKWSSEVPDFGDGRLSRLS